MQPTLSLPSFSGLREIFSGKRQRVFRRDEEVGVSAGKPKTRTGDGAGSAHAEAGGSPGALDAPRLKLQTVGLAKSYEGSAALHPVDLKVYAGELLALLGPSGSGKTTLLQIICGLVEPTDGRLIIDGRDETERPAHARDIGVVFQNYALFPHLTVRENVAFPLQMRRTAAAEVRGKVETTLALVGLSAFGDRFPRELSGGQQ